MITKVSNFLIQNKLRVIGIVILFYVVGVVGIATSQTLFITLFPFALVLSFLTMMLYDSSSSSSQAITCFSLIFLVSLVLEIIGVNTHQIFGSYSYGEALGFKLLHTPLLIGLNWVMLVYSSASLAQMFVKENWSQVIVASVFMVVYDFVLEQVAPFLQMWSWDQGVVPLKNYLDWFIIALLFQAILKRMRIKTNNPVASAIFVAQFVFFVAILILIK
jgi:putative membrane protein